MSNFFIILDIETTGLSHHNHEITEIGAIKVDCNTLEILDTFSTLINIDGNISSFITMLTGITKTMCSQEGMNLNRALRQLVVFCDNGVMYAHNASFDKRFIRAFLQREKIYYISTNWIDTINIFKKKWPGRRTYKLESLIIDHNLASSEEHRALSDAMHTLALIKK